MADPPAVLLVADAGPEIGGGHVMRLLTLARALRERGAAPAMLAPEAAGPILAAFAPADLPRTLLPGGDAAGLAAAAATLPAEVVVFDHFTLDAAGQGRGAAGRPAAAIDDLADRPMAVDLLVDPGPDRRAEDYAGLTGARLLLGPAHALVRPEFVAGRPAALARRAQPEAAAGRVLVSLGLTDVGAITARVLDRVLPRLGQARLDVVLGAGAPSLGQAERLAARDPRVALHVESRDMAALAAAADLAIGAGGSSTWERCVLGLPSLLLVLAANQAPSAAALARRGAAAVVEAAADDFEAAFDRQFTGLMRDAGRRRRMAQAAAGLCDGDGAARVAEAVLSLRR